MIANKGKVKLRQLREGFLAEPLVIITGYKPLIILVP
jgi:hypothetical protein